MRKLFKILVWLVVLVAVAGGLYAWARSSKGDKDGNKLVAVEKGAITEKAIAVGQIQPRQKFQVKSKIPGIIKRCSVNRIAPASVNSPSKPPGKPSTSF